MTVTDDARAEAERRYNSAVLHSDLTYPAHALESHRQGAFVAGAEWAAGRAETVGNDGLTDAEREEYARRYRTGPAFQSVRTPLAAGRAETATATVEDAARVLYLHDRHDITPPGFGERMWAEGHADGGVRQKYLGYAQALADAGLLAHPLPDRDEFAEVLADTEPDVAPGYYEAQADAVLDLLRSGGDDR